MKLGSTTRAVLACAAGGLLATGCGGATGGGAAPEETATPHGYVEGAEETAEAQWRLVMADTGTGALHMLDPATEEVTEVGSAPGAEEAAADGRFAYFGTGSGAVVLDSGTWTVDHGDHVHYYRADPAVVGEVEAEGPIQAAADTTTAALTSRAGVRLLDRAALEEGGTGEPAAREGAAALPYGGHVVAVGADGAVTVLDRDGEPAGTAVDARCPDPAGQALTRRGAVLGCADGALVLTEDDGAWTADTVPYPDGAPAGPVTAFHHRPGAAVLAGAAGGGDGGVWVLDVGERAWTHLDTGPAAAVSAAGEELPVLVLGEDGTLRAYDPATGEQTAAAELMDEAPEGAAVLIDTNRAYVNEPAADAVHEIDYNDDLRLARTFDLGFSPDLMVETGW
ncbi:hypothetical protein ACFPZ0_19185 [Streptomonospora nanhaiensis]|uniref:hypothetical protein n=1 Tax=Streptomonospora nanhaiensis TaxID=1323731 RepID=UPI001C9A09C2|nr:hypothetical protein [Streptomonospora nanhaiensis]MBX9390193.1 hypothetical protein [Streptomonospora nanhaiensis]